MSIPEVEVRSCRQQGGESLKDAWYRISDARDGDGGVLGDPKRKVVMSTAASFPSV